MRHHPQRYQLGKIGARIVAQRHPWIFATHLSSAASVFSSGQWLELVDHANATVGFGIYDGQGIHGIRVFKWDQAAPTLTWVDAQVRRALERRQPLRRETDALRLIHGENDAFPGVVFDLYGDVGVLATYAPCVDTLGRYLAQRLRRQLNLRAVFWRMPTKRARQDQRPAVRRLFGPDLATVRCCEGGRSLVVDIVHGQKTGAFLDLRHLRRWVSAQDWRGARVLNLFSHTGTLGQAARHAGAAWVRNVDIAPKALAFGQVHHGDDQTEWIAADVFSWLAAHDRAAQYQLVICDPPSLASHRKQVPIALRSYRHLHRNAAAHIAVGGILVVCCCTSRIARDVFAAQTRDTLGRAFQLVESLPPERDHPVAFPEGDYLKVLIYRRTKP